MRKIFLISAVVLLSSFSVWAQQKESYSMVIENLLEEQTGNTLLNPDYNSLAEELEYYYNDPIDLNSAAYEELKGLWFLTEFQIRSLLEYRNRSGKILSEYELELIDGFNNTTVQNLLLFAYVGNGEERKGISLSKAIKYSNNDIYIRASSVLENPVGYRAKTDSSDNRYLGNKLSLYSRYQMQYNKKLYAGIVMEKDAGEYFFKGENRYGFDFYSAHIQVRDLGIIKNLVIGDYSVQFGQGLVSWSSSLSGKSPYVMNICKYAAGLKKYSSTNENMFMRGMGLTIGKERVSFTSFASYKNIDAGLQYDSILHARGFFTSFPTSGLHTDEKSVREKNSLTETILGANAKYSQHNLSVSVSGIAYRFSHPLLPIDNFANLNSFRGSENYNIGTDFRFLFKNMHLFGEAAMSANLSSAFLLGSLFNLHDNFNVSLLYRNYPKDYHALYSSGFGETSNTRNERGYYVGTQINLLKNWKLSGYFDSYTFPWIKLGVDSPSEGYEYLVQADFVPSDKVSMYWRYRNKMKSKNSDVSPEINELPVLYAEDKSSFRYQINYRLSDKWEFRNRLELTEVYSLSDIDKGVLAYQDIICSPFWFPLSVSFRYAYFDTDSYLSRAYAYESDILYSYSVLPYYENGTRSYIMLTYNINKRVNFWLRYSYTWYVEKQIIGSDLNKIGGDRKSDIKFQIRIRF